MQRTRERILAEARGLFRDRGLEGTTTRDIAAAAGIATGTLFNYFPTKEALAASILVEDLEAARIEFEGRRRGDESAEELLFAHVAVGLRHLAPHRRYLGEVLETTLSPFAKPGVDGQADELRLGHLETVHEILATCRPHGPGRLSVTGLHLYWTLYLGVLAFWAADDSPHQEGTLALLDRSMRLFVSGLDDGEQRMEDDDAPHDC